VFNIINRLLTRLNKNSDVVKNQYYSLLNFLITVVLSLLTIKIITANIDPESYGIYRYVLAVIGLCSITTITGINKTVGGYVAKGFHGTVKKTTILSFKTGSIGILILISFGLYSLYMNNYTTESILFFTAALYLFPFTIFNRYVSILAGLEKFKKILIYSLAYKIILISAAVIIVLVLKKGILAYGVSQLLITAILLIYFYFSSIRYLTKEEIDSGFFKHSMIISLIGIGNQIIAPGLQLILNTTLGSGGLAFYVIGNRIPSQFAGIVKPIIHPISIRLAKKGKIEYNTSVLKLIPLTLIMGLFLYLILYAMIHYFGQYIISESYSVALYYAKLLGLVILFSPTSALLNSNVIFEKNNRGVTVSVVTNHVITIFCYIIFLGKYGIPAIAITNVVALIIQILILVFYVSRRN